MIRCRRICEPVAARGSWQSVKHEFCAAQQVFDEPTRPERGAVLPQPPHPPQSPHTPPVPSHSPSPLTRSLSVDPTMCRCCSISWSLRTSRKWRQFCTRLLSARQPLTLILALHAAQPINSRLVSQVCQRFGDVFTRARGMYLCADDDGEMSSMIYNWPHDNVQVSGAISLRRCNQTRFR